jgi:hypothetical protein
MRPTKLADLLCQKTTRYIYRKHLREQVLHRLTQQRDEFRTEETGLFDCGGNVDTMITLATFAPIPTLTILGDNVRFIDEFYLLKSFWRFGCLR